MKYLVIAAMAFASLVPFKHALHMFQQNRYELHRYRAWLKENLSVFTEDTTLLSAAFVSLAAALFLKEELRIYVFLINGIAAGAAALVREKKKSYIKPLVYTDRVKRQIAVTAVLFLAVGFITAGFGRWAYAAGYLLCAVMPWLLIWPMSLLTAPIEHRVQMWYLNDAKRILREHGDMQIIGITGSYGKTSTKNVVQAVLSEQFYSLMTPASYNTPMGITRTVREMMKPVHQVFVCEMGADKAGDITELMEFVHPRIGIVTSIGPQHLATFGSQENITKEKMQMIEMLPEDGLGILNYDNEFIRSWKVRNKVNTVTYSIDHPGTDYRAEDISYGPSGSSFTIVCHDERYPMETKLLGRLNILNILSAVAAARYLGVDWKVIRKAVRSMKQVEHRLEQKKINGLNFIDDAFNSNPSGSAMALDVLSGMPGTRYIVTPGMIDLGTIQAEVNRKFGTQMKGKADYVLLVGEKQTEPIRQGLEEAGFDMSHVITAETVKEAFAYLWQNAGPSDTILLENDLPDAFSK